MESDSPEPSDVSRGRLPARLELAEGVRVCRDQGDLNEGVPQHERCPVGFEHPVVLRQSVERPVVLEHPVVLRQPVEFPVSQLVA